MTVGSVRTHPQRRRKARFDLISRRVTVVSTRGASSRSASDPNRASPLTRLTVRTWTDPMPPDLAAGDLVQPLVGVCAWFRNLIPVAVERARIRREEKMGSLLAKVEKIRAECGCSSNGSIDDFIPRNKVLLASRHDRRLMRHRHTSIDLTSSWGFPLEQKANVRTTE